MVQITVYLSIEHSKHFGSEALYRRTLDTPFLPRTGDRIVLYPYEPDKPDDGPMGVVAELWWAADGSVAVDLEHFVQDPSEQMERHVGHGTHTLHAWRTEDSGDLATLLLNAGWVG